MLLFRLPTGACVEHDGRWFRLSDVDWDRLLDHPDLAGRLRAAVAAGAALTERPAEVLAPIVSQEVWAAGVTYLRSKAARMEEAQDGGSVYDRVYAAARPELFFKATPHRVAGPGQAVRIRADSRWNVPEPELALVINSRGQIVGTTIGNDMSSRDIEGENPLYLPQAKLYDRSCALGPGILVGPPPGPATAIRLDIVRAGDSVFRGSTTLAQLKRTPEELVGWLMRDNRFPHGVILLTGTGIIPPNEFTLLPGDEVRIAIDGLGELVNRVEQAAATAD